jgi:hypothetical protein
VNDPFQEVRVAACSRRYANCVKLWAPLFNQSLAEIQGGNYGRGKEMQEPAVHVSATIGRQILQRIM